MPSFLQRNTDVGGLSSEKAVEYAHQTKGVNAMSFGQNLQFLRKICSRMTQEELADKMNVSRQTISKWELDTALPEIDKAIELCRLFSCTMDELLCQDLTLPDEAYSPPRIEWVEPLRYVRYAVVSCEPESDALAHVRKWAAEWNLPDAQIIGWDFPLLSQEQINVYNMHGYAAVLLLPEDCEIPNQKVFTQPRQKYIAITIRNPHLASFRLIPNAYKTLDAYLKINGLTHNRCKGVLDCFEKEYDQVGVHYMDVYISIE